MASTKCQSGQMRKVLCSHNNTDSMSESKSSEVSIQARKKVAMAYGKLVTCRGIGQRGNILQIIGPRFLTVGEGNYKYGKGEK